MADGVGDGIPPQAPVVRSGVVERFQGNPRPARPAAAAAGRRGGVSVSRALMTEMSSRAGGPRRANSKSMSALACRSTPGGLCESLLEEVQADGGLE